MTRLSFRPRPLDIHKKLPVVKSIKDLEDDEAPASTRNSQFARLASEVDNEVWILYLSTFTFLLLRDLFLHHDLVNSIRSFLFMLLYRPLLNLAFFKVPT